jgi:hypothetical protein
VEYGTAQPAGAEAKGTMRDDCISGRESKVFELRSEKPQPTGSRNEEAQCLCEMGGAFLAWIWLSLTSSLIVFFSVSECY